MSEPQTYTTPSQSGAYKWLILVNIMITTFMAVLDATVVNTGLPVIMGTLGASMNSAEWILTGYMLSMATVLSIAGWLSNRFGYKNVFIFALAIFTIGSFMCGNSTSINELVFWRVIEGIGGGLLMPVGMSIVSIVFPPEERGTALGFWAIATAASVSFGPMIGGYLVDNFNWNYIFYVNIPIGIFCIIFTFAVQRQYTLTNKTKFDWLGFISSSLFLPVFLFGLSQVNSSTNPSGWSSPVVMGCMWIAAVSFIYFLYHELNTSEPLIELSVFKDKNFAMSNIVIFIFGTAMFGSTFLIPLYMQDTLGYSAYEAGLVFLPVGIIQAVSSPIAGKLCKIIDPRYIIITGLALLSYSFYMNNGFTYQTDHAYILRSLIFRGAGMGILYPPLLTIALKNVSIPLMPHASSITNIMRQIGGSFGVAIFTYLLHQRRQFHSERYSEALNFTGEKYTETINNLQYYFQRNGSVNHNEAISHAKDYVTNHLNIEAYISGLGDDFLIGCLFAALAIIPVLFLTSKQKKR